MIENYTIVSFAREAQLFNAGSKAPSDMIRFVRAWGGKSMLLPYIDENRFTRVFRIPGFMLKLAVYPGPGSSLVFVFPEHVQHKTAMAMLRMLKPWFRWRRIRLVAIVSDVEFYRFDRDPEWDIKCLTLFDKAVVHSPAMLSVLRENGYPGEMSVHNLYDYYVSVPNTVHRHNGYSVCFAGNLAKSVFLSEMVGLRLGRVQFYLYGTGMSDSLMRPHVHYMGKFSPDDLSSIEGDWGLVWDGDTALALGGNLGRYLRINSPHKASMYLCAGLPLIVPEGSFAADIVRQYGLGLVISSIADLEDAIGTVSDERYAEIIENVHSYASRLTAGQNLIDSLV